MKEIKLSFPYPSTSRHNLSQDIALSMSMGLVIPVRVVKVLGGDSHRIGTSYSLVSNPLVKPLLQGVKMRFCRFWVPSRIYSIDQRANNANFDILEAPVRTGAFASLNFPVVNQGLSASNFQQSSLFDYLQIANIESNFVDTSGALAAGSGAPLSSNKDIFRFNAEPYLCYIDICRNYFADSATGMIGWSSSVVQSGTSNRLLRRGVCVSPLTQLDAYIDGVQNSHNTIKPYNWTVTSYNPDVTNSFTPFVLTPGSVMDLEPVYSSVDSAYFSRDVFGASHVGFCVPLNRPDRLSRLFDTRPLTSQNASVAASEVTIGNLSMLSKIQRYLTRTFFGGSRFSDIMYSVLGQKVPHVDSPVLLDVFDQEIGSELVASTNATDQSNPGVLGGFFSSSGNLRTGRGSFKRRYRFNEPGYLIDCAYIQPRLFRSAFCPDFYFISTSSTGSILTDQPMSQGNFIPDFNGIGWQQPSFVQGFLRYSKITGSESVPSGGALGFCCEPSWQQYRTLPDICMGAFAANRSTPAASVSIAPTVSALNINSPIYIFTDRMNGENYYRGFRASSAAELSDTRRYMLAQFAFTDFNMYNRIFGTDTLVYDNFFVVFRYAHQAKRQVSKRFTLTFA